MNYIDLFAVLIIVISILVGYNQGFLKSLLSIGNILLSILIGLIFYGVTARDIASDPQIVPTVVHFSEASELLGGIENERISVYEPYEQIANLLENLNLPYPLTNLLEKNIENHAFASSGLETLGDYLGQTIGNMTINYVSFVIVFFISFVILLILINIGDHVFELPVLRSMDSVAGAIGGFVQGLLLLNIVFLAVPLVLAFLPFEEILEFVEGSSFSKLYYYQNVLTKLIRGVI